MSAERACQCGRGYFATSPYDYSCPDCWTRECEDAVRTIEWVGGVAPPGCLVVERTAEMAATFGHNYGRAGVPPAVAQRRAELGAAIKELNRRGA